jgi:phosphate starvation-inducible PhoH-like protein
MNTTEVTMNIPNEHAQNIFGQYDKHIKKIERTLSVTMILRDDLLKIIGTEPQVKKTEEVFNQLLALSKRGNTITEQNVDYVLSLSFHDQTEQMSELDRDIICHTVQGKPVNAKTL